MANPGSVGRPKRGEAADYYFTYIDRVSTDDPVGTLEAQMEEVLATLGGISEEGSLHRYAPDKWSLRQLLAHVSDTERVFAYRALWFARGFHSPLPDFDQGTAAASARSDDVPWNRHLQEFREVRGSTISLFRNLPTEAWMRRGMASGNTVSVRALAYIAVGHADHHLSVVRERYL